MRFYNGYNPGDVQKIPKEIVALETELAEATMHIVGPCNQEKT